MQNLVVFPHTLNTIPTQGQFSGLVTALQNSNPAQVNGIGFSVSPDLIAAGNFGEIDAYLALPLQPGFLLGFSINCTALTGSSYPFQTISVPLSDGAEMRVPVIVDPAFAPWLVGLWQAVLGHLTAVG